MLGREREARRCHQGLLRAGDDDVNPPAIGFDWHRTEARDSIDDRDRAGLVAGGHERADVGDDAGRRLRVHEQATPAPLSASSRATSAAPVVRPHS